MELFNEATALSTVAVLVLTELAKLVPVQFTSRYPAWVNAILSAVAAFIVVKPSLDFHDLTALFATFLLVGVTAAISYNAFTSKLVSFTGTTPATK